MAQSGGRQRVGGIPIQQLPLGALQMVEKRSTQVLDLIRAAISEELKRVASMLARRLGRASQPPSSRALGSRRIVKS